MADRTLRRNRERVEGNANSNAGSDNNGSRTIAEPIERVAGSESIIDGVDANTSESVLNTDDGTINVVEIDPADISDYVQRTESESGTGDQPRKRRGRKPGSGTGPRKKAPDSIEGFLLMAHTWGATLLKCPELMASQDECKTLSDAYVEFAKHHDIQLLSAKRMSEINLIGVLVMMYGSRMIAIRNRIKTEQRVAKARNVTTINENGNGTPFQSQHDDRVN